MHKVIVAAAMQEASLPNVPSWAATKGYVPHRTTTKEATMKPYYEDESVKIYHADCRDVLPQLDKVDLVLTDPPYGIGYNSNQIDDGSRVLARSIAGDLDTAVRDEFLDWWGDRPALVFGSWKKNRPVTTKMLLIWDTLGALGMGDLSLPWKPSHQEIYVLGSGFSGKRTSDVLRYPPVQSMSKNGRTHPHEKPVALIRELLGKCPTGTILDPFMGSGTTLRAAKDLNRKAIGIEIEERYCEIAANRMAQLAMEL
jgi:DNA modification methylase